LPTKEGVVLRYGWVFSNGDWCFFNYNKGLLHAVSNTGSIGGVLLEKVEKFEYFRTRFKL